MRTMTRIARENDGRTVAVATHGGFLRAFLTYVHFDDVEKMSQLDWIHNAAVTYLHYQNGRFAVVFEDNRDFLPEELRNGR